MACILNIETYTSVCSVALSSGKDIIFSKTAYGDPSHASLVGVYSKEAINEMKARGLKLDAVAVSCGPGSYTGLRIGVSFAKGLCLGEDIPLIAIPTLRVMVEGAKKTLAANDIDVSGLMLCPMIDARRMEVYAAIYKDGEEIRSVGADIIDENSYADYFVKGNVCFFGNGSDKCRSVLTSPNAMFIENIYPLAENMIGLANDAYEAKRFENVAYYEPFYLKEFQATIAKNKVLGNR